MFDNQLYANGVLTNEILNRITDGVILITDTNILYANKLIIKSLSLNSKLNFPSSFENFFATAHKDLTKELLAFQKEKNINRAFQYLHFDVDVVFLINEKEKLYLYIFKKTGKQENFKVPGSTYAELFPFIYLETSKLGQITKCNQQFEDQLHYHTNDLQNGLMLTQLASKGSKTKIDNLFSEKKAQNKKGKIELKLKGSIGDSFHGSMYYKPLYEQGSFSGYQCLIIDISDNKKIEFKYKRNQQRLRKVLDLVPHQIYLKDQYGNILLANQACADFYNTTTKKLVYSNLSEYHKDEKELNLIIDEDKEVILNKEKSIGNISMRTNMDKEKRVFESSKVPFTDPETEQVHALGISVDITEKRKVEQEIELTKEKYRLLVERGTEGIMIIQNDSIVFANRQAAKIFGRTYEDFINYPLSRYINPTHLTKFIEQYVENFKNRQTDNYYDLKIYKPDGDIAYIEAQASIINFEGKKSRLVFIRDITKRKIAEKRSLRDKNLLLQAQKIAKLGSWEWDVQRSLFHCSDEVYSILELEGEDVVNRSPRWLSSFIPKIDKSRVINSFLYSVRTGERLDMEFPIVTNNGSRKIIHSQSQVFNDRDGKPERIIGTWLDISERIKFEQVLKEAKAKAEESDKLKSAFLANMSHEIRTPMNAILGFSNLLKKPNLETNTRMEYIDHIQQSGEGLLKLINDIIDVSKIESNQLQIEKTPLRVNQLLDQIYNRYEELLLLSNKTSLFMTLEKALPDPNFTIVSDAFRLQQVISNLINNSIKFTSDGHIKFGYSITNSTLMFFVEDQGIGIPEDKRQIIFKRFGKLDDPGQMNKSGTGLGLSISKSLVELMGGKIWLDKGDPGSTRFCFTIPLEIGETKPKSFDGKYHINDGALELNNKTILIAEDEHLNFKLLETLLKKTGVNILWAKNGLEAVELATTEEVDLVFMDIKMPELNGYEATKMIKDFDKNIPIIAQTAFAFSNERKFILQSGCDMYLTKPINHEEIYKILHQYLVKE